MPDQKYNIVIFAYNEEYSISDAIYSALENCDERLYKLYVLVNGCTDRTREIVDAIRVKVKKLHPVEIALGDKSNAWNTYVHTLADNVDIHFFGDGDVTYTRACFSNMANKLLATQESIAIAGLPFSGRNKDYYRSLVVDGVCLFGNCYGVRQEFIELARAKNFKLPIGMTWEDSLITKAINCNITNQYQTVPDRITYDLKSGYRFESLKFYKLKDIETYLGRIARYSVGKLQERELNKLEFYEYPEDLSKINNKIRQGIEKNTINVPFYLKSAIIKRLNKNLSVE